MITTPPATTPNNIITGDGNSSRQFLDERLDVVPEYHDDRARLQNIVRFLREIKVKLGDMNKQWWSSSDAELIRRELFTARNARTEEYRTGRRKFDQRPEGDRASSAFVPVAQQDLITLTLEILARGPVTDVAELQREAFRDAYEGFIQVAFTRAKEQAIEQRLGRQLEVARVLSPQEQTVLIGIENQASDSTDTVKRALGPVMQGLWPQTNNTHSS
ncbi:hypothetical protein EDB92DRAFT_1861512 [Lactarius akahatsu]|uniref:Uncharacterized protein n=1 Tax=Lactarius akahatsu TaxID=416441 RepID=A0AAD4QAN2_9AGAM|nr:hypothetical protein EDB92DRAFT_1861512 [Lactarius akahatsu]